MVVFFHAHERLMQLFDPLLFVQGRECFRVVLVESLLDLQTEGLVLSLVPLVQCLQQRQFHTAGDLSLYLKYMTNVVSMKMRFESHSGEGK